MPPELSPEQLAPELIGTGAKAIVDNAERLGLTWKLSLATIATPDEGAITATYDGDTVAIGMTNMMPFTVIEGQRVYVIFVPPSGNYIVGTPVGQTPLVTSLLELVYPVGAIYMSTVDADPGTFLGGTWAAMTNRVLIGAGGIYAGGDTGGATTHDHTQPDIGSSGTHTTTATAGLPSSTQGIAVGATTVASDTHGHTITVSGTGSHTHVTPNTDSSSNLPPYTAVFMWKRTA